MFISYENCKVCGYVTLHRNNKCSECSGRQEKIRLMNWRSMTEYEKFEDLRKRIEKLEKGTTTYRCIVKRLSKPI